MPRTPPIIMPKSPSVNWFSNKDKEKEPKLYDNLEDLDNLSPFTYSPSDDDESVKSKTANKDKKLPRKSNQSRDNTTEETLYHKPTSNHSTQQSRHSNENILNQQYELLDEDDSQNGEQRSDHNSNIDTQYDEEKFNSVVDDLRSDFKLYTDEYKEFKRHVDNAKRELLEYIQHRTVYFEERGSYLYHKWDSLRQLI